MSLIKIKKFYIILVSIFSCLFVACAAKETVSNASAAVGDESDVIAFVGQKISFQEVPKTKIETMPDGRVLERKIPSGQTRYEAVYEVLSWASEERPFTRIEFELYDIYSEPYLPHITTPLIFLINQDGRWVYYHNSRLVSQTTDDDWGICGQLKDRYVRDKGKSYVQSLDFVEPVKDHNGHNCKEGMRVKDIFTHLNEIHFLPQKRYAQCKLELNIKKFSVLESHNQKLLNACVERLKLDERHK